MIKYMQVVCDIFSSMGIFEVGEHTIGVTKKQKDMTGFMDKLKEYSISWLTFSNYIIFYTQSL